MRVRSLLAGLGGSCLAVVALGAATACGDDAAAASTPVPEAGTGETGPEASSATAVQKGRIIDAVDKFGVSAATVTAAGNSVTTKEDGTYEIAVPRNVPYSVSVTEPEHFKLNDQAMIFKKDTLERGDTSLLGTSIASILASLLPPRDVARGLLVVRVNPLPPCDSEEGSTITIEPAGTSKVTYFASGRPDKSRTSALKDEAFSAAISDVDVGVPIKVTVQSPRCEQVPFPIDVADVTYTGVQQTEPGNVLSYIRVYIGPTKIADAGAD